jgi:hypothetical protein
MRYDRDSEKTFLRGQHLIMATFDNLIPGARSIRKTVTLAEGAPAKGSPTHMRMLANNALDMQIDGSLPYDTEIGGTGRGK